MANNAKPRGESAPRAAPQLWREIPWLVLAVRYRKPLAALAVAIAAALGARSAWRLIGPRTADDDRYLVAAAHVAATPRPEWINADVVAEALRDASLNGRLSLLDDDLCPRLAKAFALHPWVSKVARVEKRAGPSVEVVLEYRRPACMVEVSEGGEPGLFPVDTQGVLLPTSGFTPAAAAAYPRLGGIRAGAWGPVGSPGRDANIARGASIAAVLADSWESLSLTRIAPAEKTAGSSSEAVFILETRNGDRIVWGAAPGQESDDEPSAAAKLARLTELLGEEVEPDEIGHGPFDLRRPYGEARAATGPKR